MDELFSVTQFFKDESYETVRRYVPAEEAMQAFQHYCTSIGVKLGFTKRVIITDIGDCICAEWINGKGLTFPTKEMREAAANDPETSAAARDIGLGAV